MRKSQQQYLPHDAVMVFNDEDPRLAKNSLIIYELPSPPIAEHIHNFGLPAEECFWRPFKPSHKLQVLMDRNDLTDNQKIQFIEDNQDYYKNEILWIQEETRRGEEGFWMYIGTKDDNGVLRPKPYWIPPYHYDFLQSWDVGGGLPDFRMRDRKFYCFWHMVLYDKSCTGFNYPKHRREGATTKVQEIRYKLISSMSDAKSGLQSKTKKDAEEVHENLLMKPWRRLPFWKRPIWDGDERKKDEINFSAPSSKMHPDYGKKALDSKLDYRESGVFAYDSTRQELIHNDEIGKCLAAGTKLLMFNGSYKNVEDVVVGDLLMGVGSQPRKVLSLHRGEDEMYEIIPTKGEKWSCNQEHILSLKWACKSQKFRGHKKGQTVNIPVKDFIKISSHDKKHLMQYRDCSDWPEKTHKIPPYLLGLWLGDGSSAGPTITNVDSEVLAYIRGYCDSNGLFIHTTKITHRITTKKLNSKTNTFLNGLNHYGLIKNKHIPEEFLIDSRENRLSLLAGIIDTDGHKLLGKNKAGYEIVQKNKTIAYDIQKLATHLGFYCSVNEKTASMKRKGRDTYYSKVYRVFVFGNNLQDIPCLIDKKKQKIIEQYHVNRRNPNHTGITVRYIGRGNYYGFSLDGDRLFLLSDGTVTHNTSECDVVNRLQVQLPCVYRGGRIIGKIINTSTVAEITKQGGAAFRQICDNSHYLKKDANGRTLYGLYNLFIPADDGFELEMADVNRICEQIGRPKENTGYPDKYGFCDKEICGTFLRNRRKAFLDKGDMDGYIEECRLYPLSWDDCWMQSASNNNFNIVIINDRMNILRSDEMREKIIRGDFVWKDNIADSKVIFVPSERGRFYVSYLFPNPGVQSNRMYVDENGQKCPDNPAFTAGADPFKFRRTAQNKRSDGAGAVFWDFDSTVDNRSEPMDKWKSNRFVCTYSNRPDDKYAYAEDMLKMCIYYGCEMNSERNVDLINEHFEERGYAGFLLNKLSKTSNKMEKIPGEYASVGIIEEIFREYQHYIQRFGQNEMHIEILQQCLDISDDMNDFDLFAAGGYALLGAKRKRSISERYYSHSNDIEVESFTDEDFSSSDEDYV